jgi:hypothetical protein
MECERSLPKFIERAWHTVEPGTTYLPNWHIDAMCDYLEAVDKGQITRLVINIPARYAKSSVVSVFWPVHDWINRPESRWMFTSYSDSLSTQHSVNRRTVIVSPWYQKHWASRFSLSDDRNLKTEFANDHQGIMTATSIGGTATGKGGDRLVCFPEDEIVHTINGPVPIGEMVRRRLGVKVKSRRPDGRMSWEKVVGWHENPGRPIYKIVLNDGSTVRCTGDHRVLTENRGWIEASNLKSSDVLPCLSLHDVADCGAVDAVSASHGPNRLAACPNSDNISVRQLGHRVIGSTPDVTGFPQSIGYQIGRAHV